MELSGILTALSDPLVYEEYDNAPLENIFGSLKNESVRHGQFQNHAGIRYTIVEYSERFNNGKRLHHALAIGVPRSSSSWSASNNPGARDSGAVSTYGIPRGKFNLTFAEIRLAAINTKINSAPTILLVKSRDANTMGSSCICPR
jgi:hypothetical protein